MEFSPIKGVKGVFSQAEKQKCVREGLSAPVINGMTIYHRVCVRGTCRGKTGKNIERSAPSVQAHLREAQKTKSNKIIYLVMFPDEARRSK